MPATSLRARLPLSRRQSESAHDLVESRPLKPEDANPRTASTGIPPETADSEARRQSRAIIFGIGEVVGAFFVLSILALVLWLSLRRRRKKKALNDAAPSAPPPPPAEAEHRHHHLHRRHEQRPPDPSSLERGPHSASAGDQSSLSQTTTLVPEELHVVEHNNHEHYKNTKCWPVQKDINAPPPPRPPRPSTLRLSTGFGHHTAAHAHAPPMPELPPALVASKTMSNVFADKHAILPTPSMYHVAGSQDTLRPIEEATVSDDHSSTQFIMIQPPFATQPNMIEPVPGHPHVHEDPAVTEARQILSEPDTYPRPQPAAPALAPPPSLVPPLTLAPHPTLIPPPTVILAQPSTAADPRRTQLRSQILPSKPEIMIEAVEEEEKAETNKQRLAVSRPVTEWLSAVHHSPTHQTQHFSNVSLQSPEANPMVSSRFSLTSSHFTMADSVTPSESASQLGTKKKKSKKKQTFLGRIFGRPE